MASVGQGSGDAHLIVAIKEAELSGVRQHLAQVTDDLRRNLSVSQQQPSH